VTDLDPRALEAAETAVRAARNECRMEWGEDCTTSGELARAAVTAYIAALQETHALVPRDTSVGMRIAGHAAVDSAKPGIGHEFGFNVMQDAWRAMIDAAPPAAQEKK
jgi:hypothetical protein